MSELTKYEDQRKKMEGLLDEHELQFRFRKDTYPITFTITPTSGTEAQMSMLAEVEDKGYRAPESSMTWTFADGELDTKVSGGIFTISKVLRTKIENILLKMIYFWQQYFFREVIEHDALKKGMAPTINDDPEDPDDDEDLKDAEPLEEYEDEDAEESSDVETPDFPDDLLFQDNQPEEAAGEDQPREMPRDEWLIGAATNFVRERQEVSINALASEFHLSFAGAAKLMEQLEDAGVIGAQVAGGKRQVLPFEEV